MCDRKCAAKSKFKCRKMFYFYFAVNYIQQAQPESVVVVVSLCVRCRCVICFCFCCDAKLHLRPIRRSILKHDISDTTATATVKRTSSFLSLNRSVPLPIMQIQCMPIFQVIFVLSTIVAVTGNTAKALPHQCEMQCSCLFMTLLLSLILALSSFYSALSSGSRLLFEPDFTVAPANTAD